MKKRFRTVSVWVLAVMLATVFTFPMEVFGAKGNPNAQAKNVQYIEKNGKKTGIKSVKIDPYTYVNLSQDSTVNPQGKSTMNLSKDVLRTIARERLFPAWAPVAEAVFADQADQFVSIYADNMMSKDPKNKDAFARQFTCGNDGVEKPYTSEYWSLWSLCNTLKTKESGGYGSVNNDYTHWTGIVDMASLNDARTRMGQELRNASDDDDNSRDEFLGNEFTKSEPKRRLPMMEDAESGYGFASMVTCVNRAGKSADYDYVTYGMMIYDFELVPVAANDLHYIEAAQDYLDKPDPAKAAKEAGVPGVDFSEDTETSVKTVLKNPSQGEATQNVTLENSVTEELSNTREEHSDYSVGVEVGGEINFDKTMGVAPGYTLRLNAKWDHMWGTSKSETATKSTTNTRSISTELTMPQHTVAKVVQNVEDSTFRENFQQPTVLTYKVALFGMSGDYFNGAHCGGVSAGKYDKSYMTLLFKGTEDAVNSGHQAMGALYNRAVRNKGVPDFDSTTGNYQTWCDRNSWRKAEGIDWTYVSNYVKNNKVLMIGAGSVYEKLLPRSHIDGSYKDSLEDFSKEIPIVEKGSMVTGRKKVITSSVSQFEPMYDLKKVTIKPSAGSTYIDTRNYTLNPGASLPLDNVVLEGKNKDNYDFFGFDQYQMGHWIPCTETGGARTQTTDDAAQLSEPAAGKGQLITTKAEVAQAQTCWFKWVFNDDADITSNESPSGIDKSKVELPLLSVKVLSDSSIYDYDTLTLAGEYAGPVTEKVSLPKVLAVTNSRNRDVPVFWESWASNGDGIAVDERTGEVTFSKPGNYKVRAYCLSNAGNRVYSNYVDITAVEETKLDHFTLTAPDLTEAQRTLTQKKPELTFDAGQWIGFYDQYDKVWPGEVPAVNWSVDDEDIASVDSLGNLTVTGPGTVRLTASIEGLGEKSVDLTILRSNWLAEVVFEEPDLEDDQLVLTDTVKSVRVSNLKNLIKFYDSNENEWTGSTPKVTFSVESGPEGGGIKNGNFVATEGGTYVLQAFTSNGLESNAIPLVVEDRSSLVLTTEDPEEQILTDSDHPVQVALPKSVIAKTKRGGNWYGDLPELKYTLADGTKNASIAKKTLNNTETMVFSCTRAGTYTVKVTPKDPKEYAGSIRDIRITATGTYVQWGPWEKDSDQEHVRYALNEDGSKDYAIAQAEGHTWKGVWVGKSDNPDKPDIVRYVCTKCGAEQEKAVTVAHDWSEPTYTVDKGFDYVTAERHCKHEGCLSEREMAAINITSEVKGDMWYVTHTATFKNPAFKWSLVDEYPGSQGADKPKAKKAAKKAGVLKAKGKTVKIKASKLKKKSVKIKVSKAIKVTSATGKLSYKKGKVKPKKMKKKFKVNKKTGTITVKKGLKKGTYKVKVKVRAAGDATHTSKTKTVTVRIKVR